MNQQVTLAIVLRRTDYDEADRILSVITPDHGKLALMAKGARRSKSKLAGGIELFSVNEISFIAGKRDIGTLTSSRLKKYHAHITEDLDRTMLGYEYIKTIDKLTEHATDASYFELLENGLQGLDAQEIPLSLNKLWFCMKLLTISGHSPNLETDETDQVLKENGRYNFDYERMQFVNHTAGDYRGSHIKLLRVVARQDKPIKLAKLECDHRVIEKSLLLVQQTQQLMAI